MFAIFDNGGETLDRYTIWISTDNPYSDDPRGYIVTTSGDPSVFWQHGHDNVELKLAQGEDKQVGFDVLNKAGIKQLLTELELEITPAE